MRTEELNQGARQESAEDVLRRLFRVVTPVRVVGVGLLVGGACYWLFGGGAVPAAEEIAFAYLRKGIGSGLWSMWQGGWFFPLLRLTYNAVYSIFGFHTFVPLRVFALCNVAVLIVAVYAYCRVHRDAWLGALFALYLIAFGPAMAQTGLWPLLSNFPLAIASLPLAIMLLERNTRKGDVAAVSVLLVALGFNAPATIPICGGAGLWLLMHRPLRLRRFAIPILPLALYALALVAAPSDPTVQPPEYPTAFNFPPPLVNVTRFFGLLSSSVVAGVAGLGRLMPESGAERLGFLLLVLLVVLVGANWSRLGAARQRRVAVLGSTMGASWLATAIARSNSYGTESATSARYIILGAVPLLLVLAEVLAVLSVKWRRVFVVGICVAACLNALTFVDQVTGVRYRSEIEQARAAALELAGASAPADYYPAHGLERIIFWVNARQYDQLRSRYGSLAMSDSRIPRASGDSRWEIDRILVDLRDVRVLVSTPPSVGATCAVWEGGRHSMQLPPTGAIVDSRGPAPAFVVVRRFGDHYMSLGDASSLRPGRAVVVSAKPDRSPVPWTVQIRGAARVCSI